jgi:1,4-dihydroxy-2-naphthoyl-CoA synthase
MIKLLNTLTPYGENQAECVNHDPEIWFDTSTEKHAKEICNTCPIQLKCLEYSLTEKICDGVFGGLTAAERIPLMKKRNAR